MRSPTLAGNFPHSLDLFRAGATGFQAQRENRGYLGWQATLTQRGLDGLELKVRQRAFVLGQPVANLGYLRRVASRDFYCLFLGGLFQLAGYLGRAFQCLEVQRQATVIHLCSVLEIPPFPRREVRYCFIERLLSYDVLRIVLQQDLPRFRVVLRA